MSWSTPDSEGTSYTPNTVITSPADPTRKLAQIRAASTHDDGIQFLVCFSDEAMTPTDLAHTIEQIRAFRTETLNLAAPNTA